MEGLKGRSCEIVINGKYMLGMSGEGVVPFWANGSI